MKNFLLFFLIVILVILIVPQTFAQSLQDELRMLKKRVEELERKVESGEVERREVKEISRDLKQRIEEGLLGKWLDKVEFSGLVEVESSFSDKDRKMEKDTKESDIVLATVELGIDVDIHKYVGGHLLLLWEEDDTEPVEMDEGIILLGGTDDFPFFLEAGKMYPSIGHFNSFFITDPLTLEMAETRESAVMIGYANDTFDFRAGAFNGDITDEDDDRINGLVVSAGITPSFESIEKLELTLGGYYTTNLDSDNFEEWCEVDKLDDLVGAAGGYLSAAYAIFGLEFEYITTLDNYQAGEMAFARGRKSKPSAWNLELSLSPLERLELAFRYSRTDEMRMGLDDDTLPEKMWGLIVSCELLKKVGLGLEYLHSEWEDDDKEDLITTQLAIEF